MAETTKIEWADATWNPVTGCSVTSPGCTNCYAMRYAGTRGRHLASRQGLTREVNGNHVWTGEVRLNEEWLTQPLRWKHPRRIFVCAHGDLFHESVPDEWIDRVFAVMALCPQHTFQVLTKRSARMWDYCSDPATVDRIYDLVCDLAIDGVGQVVLIAPGVPPEMAPDGRHVPLGVWPLPNVWLGISVEDQARADLRIPDLLDTPASLRWISAEPLLGPVDWIKVVARWQDTRTNAEKAHIGWGAPLIDWVVAGGESGPDARPCHPDWARLLRDQCAASGVPFFWKQWGEWIGLGVAEGRPLDDGHWPTNGDGCIRLRPDGSRGDEGFPMQRVGKKAAGRLLDGREWSGFPA